MLRDDDGLSWIRLTGADGRTAAVWMDESMDTWQVCTGDHLDAVAWRRTGVAAEPMSCIADAFRTGDRLVRLEPGAHATRSPGAWRCCEHRAPVRRPRRARRAGPARTPRRSPGLWREHLATPFPDRLRGVAPAGVDVVMADANLAGCVVTWQVDRERFDDDLRPVARALLDELDRVLPLLTIETEVSYCARLRELARLVSGVD